MLRIVLLVILILSAKIAIAVAPPCPISDIKSAVVTATQKPSGFNSSYYLYKPLVFDSNQCSLGATGQDGNISYILYLAIANSLNPTCITTPSDSSCANINYLMNQFVRSIWSGSADKLPIPEVIILSSLDYHAIQKVVVSDNFNWDSVFATSWYELPENRTDNPLCSFDGTVFNRFAEIGLFCMLMGDNSINELSSQINKITTYDNSFSKPAPSNGALLLGRFKSSDNFSLSPTNCSASQFSGIPFKGSSCDSTSFEKLYFMIINSVE